MGEKRHKNYKRASNLVFLTFGLDVMELIFSSIDPNEIVFLILGLLFLAFTGYVVRKGISWVKYILLILTLLLLAGIFITLGNVPLLSLVLNFTQAILLVTSVVLLFVIPAPTDEDALDSDI